MVFALMEEEIKVKSHRSRSNLFVTHTFGFVDLYAPYIGLDVIGWLTVLETLVDRTGETHNIRHFGIRKLGKKYKISPKRIYRLNRILELHGLLHVERGNFSKRNTYYLLDPVETESELKEIITRNAGKVEDRTGEILLGNNTAGRPRKEIPEDELRRLYEVEKKTVAEIAELFSCGKATVSRAMQRYGIKTRRSNKKQQGEEFVPKPVSESETGGVSGSETQ
jgi:DNA-binding MarR family transcriptional regulator